MYAGSSRMSGTSAEEEVQRGGLGWWCWWGGGVRGDTALTHVELTLNCRPAQIVEIGPVSADLLADSQAQLPQL